MKEENLEKRVPFEPGDERINRNGRPLGSRNRSTIVREWLSVQQKVKNPLTGTVETLDQSDMMVLALISKARKGDVAAFKELMDSSFGKIKDVVDTNISVKKPFSIKDIYSDEEETQSDME